MCKKLSSVFLALVLVFVLFFSVSKAANTIGDKFCSLTYQSFAIDPVITKTAAKSVDPDDFKKYLSEEFVKCTESIDISSFGILNTEENIACLQILINDEMVKAFHVSEEYEFRFLDDSNLITSLEMSYRYTAEEYQKMLAECEAKKNKLTADIKNNARLSDVEKALLLHDRIADICEYDCEGVNSANVSDLSFTIYGVLVKGRAVCQGYSETYKYLLEDVGIKSRFCISKKLNHVWNIVYIDSIPYHVDVTWDDPSFYSACWNPAGKVLHKNFLLSSSALFNGVNGGDGHNADDYDASPFNTKYDDFFWQNSNAAFLLIGDEIYYIDNAAQTLKTYFGGKKLADVENQWRTNEICWQDNYSCLASDGVSLYFSQPDSICKYDIGDNTNSKFYSPDLLNTENMAIYGLSYRDGKLIIDMSDSPNFDNPLSIKREYFPIGEKIPPSVAIKPSHDIASEQTVTLCFTDNTCIAGYFWGTNADYTKNAYTPSDKNELTEIIKDEGLYYLTAKDVFGNISETVFVEFVRITLDAGDGNVSPEYIITESEEEIILPRPSYSKHIFKNWADGENALPENNRYVPLKNITLTAVWEEINDDDDENEHNVMRGDIDFDGTISASDARLALRAAVRLETFEGDKFIAADADKSGEITSGDARLILRVAVGLETI